jgi:hypothetical protein
LPFFGNPSKGSGCISAVRFSSARRQVLSCTVLNASSEIVASDMSNCATSISSDSSPVPPVARYLVHFNLPPHVDDSSPVTVDEANGTGFVSCINLLLCPTDDASTRHARWNAQRAFPTPSKAGCRSILRHETCLPCGQRRHGRRAHPGHRLEDHSMRARVRGTIEF